MKEIIVQKMAKLRNLGGAQPGREFVNSTRAWFVPNLQSHPQQEIGTKRWLLVPDNLHWGSSLILTDCSGLFHHL